MGVLCTPANYLFSGNYRARLGCKERPAEGTTRWGCNTGRADMTRTRRELCSLAEQNLRDQTDFALRAQKKRNFFFQRGLGEVCQGEATQGTYKPTQLSRDLHAFPTDLDLPHLSLVDLWLRFLYGSPCLCTPHSGP